MLSIGEYIKYSLKKRGLKQQDLVNRINRVGLTEGKAFHKTHLSSHLSGATPMSVFLARKIEIVLGIQKNLLVNMIQPVESLSKHQVSKLAEIENTAKMNIEEIKNGKR